MVHRMKTNDLAGRFIDVHHQIKPCHCISQPQQFLSCPETDQFDVFKSLEFSTDFCSYQFLVKQSSCWKKKLYITESMV